MYSNSFVGEPKKSDPSSSGTCGRKQNIAGIEQRRHFLMIDMPGKDHLSIFAGITNDLLDLSRKRPAPINKKRTLRIVRHRRDGLRQGQHTMPWAKGADKTGNDFVLSDTEFLTRGVAANIGTKTFSVDAVGIDDDLFIRNIGAAGDSAARLPKLRRCVWLPRYSIFRIARAMESCLTCPSASRSRLPSRCIRETTARRFVNSLRRRPR